MGTIAWRLIECAFASVGSMLMKRFSLAAIVAIGLTGLSAGPAAARNYDCSKAGNANKSECKAAAKPAAAPAKVATKTVTKAERNYDCRLIGNKNKAACKAAATPAMPAVKHSSTTMVTRGPKSTAVTTVTTKVTPNIAKTATMSKPVVMARPKASSAEDSNPAGSIGRCKDGLYSHSKVRTGACSRHGGVAKWS
jgi:hypothetical protein